MMPSNTQVRLALTRLLVATERVERDMAAKALKRHITALLQEDVPVVDISTVMSKLSDSERRIVNEAGVAAVLGAIAR